MTSLSKTRNGTAPARYVAGVAQMTSLSKTRNGTAPARYVAGVES